MKKIILAAWAAVLFMACSKESVKILPDYGDVAIPHEYTDQSGNTISAETVDGKIYVADFFFTHCPTICPKMSQQMLRVQEAYPEAKNLKLLSFSIDPERDTVERLKWYAEKLGADNDRWHFVRAEKEKIDATSEVMKVYQEADSTAEGGFNHQGRFLLVDTKGKIRGSYNGVDPEDVDELIADLDILFNE